MKEFSELINKLLLTSSRNRKIAILSNYFQNTPDPDRGNTLAILTNELEFKNISISKIKEIVFENIDNELFTLSYDYVGDLAETIALIWPYRKDGNLPQISKLISILKNIKKNELKETIENFLSIANNTERWAIIKLISGGLRIGVSSRLAKTALAKFSNETALKSVGANTYKATQKSGEQVLGSGLESNFGEIISGALESSNTNILNEMVNLLQTQQAFNGNARILQSNVDVTRRLMDS